MRDVLSRFFRSAATGPKRCGVAICMTALSLFSANHVDAQVTTATLVGLVRDNSAAIIPGANVVATNEGTGVTRESVTDANGEVVLSALPAGTYTVRIELGGFKTISQRGIQLGAGQTVRQTFTLEVGAMSETITVTGESPLIQTAMSLQADSVGSQEVRELPVNRRNIQNLIGLTAGVVITGTGAAGGSGGVQMNGVASGGTGITVDGTEANSNPEGRSLTQYGSENQISVMSLDSIAEIQIVKGVLPAEYGGVAGGQINVISRSGTNNFRGSSFYSGQNEKWNANDFFSTAPHPVGHFNQYGGTLGGPVVHNKVFFFGTYEGYRERVELNLNTTVPYQAVRDEVLRALPQPETKIALDTLYLPTEPIVSTAGVVNPQVGRWRGLGVRERSENHVVAKTDMAVFNGADLTFTYTRLRPFSLDPRPNPNGANDREFPNRQDRIAAQYVMTRGAWVSESRVGWNKAFLARLDKFLSVIGPNQPAEIMPYGRRVASFSVSGLFGTAHSEILEMAGNSYSVEQKLSRGFKRHLVKTGFRFLRETGSHINPEDPAFTYQTYADLLANLVNSHNTTYGAPPHGSRMDQYGAFVQDDWRLGSKFVLNLGLRWDYYGVAQVYATTPVPVELVNLENPTDLRKLDFGPKRDPLHPYEPDGNNFGPRLGYAWTLGANEATVVRGGLGYLYSPTLPMTVRQAVNHPTIPYRVVYNRTESAARNIRWPMYTDDALPLAQADSAGRAAVFSLIDTNLAAPYTIQSMASVQQAFDRTMAAEVGYIRTDGNDFPLQRQFTQAFDRQTGVRPNPALGAPGGYYVDSSQTMLYNGLQTSLRRRFSDRYSWDVNYTLGKSDATQGGDLSVYYITSYNAMQDFWNPELDYGPSTNDIRHRFNASFIYELPGVNGGKGVLNACLGGWQISGIVQARSGFALIVTQPSGIGNSRPDVAPGVDLVVADWKDSCPGAGCSYLNTAGFIRVPVSSVTNATLRPGTFMPEMVRGPGEKTLHTTLAKGFPLGAHTRLQVRAEVFNLLNWKNYNNPQTNMNNADFGRITGAGRPRVFQFGARLTF
jgi:Carboxypeptidase regulatory-like domain/TonB dependent receptor-like, beta-barrel/TonB-dependent Receptor Plug Domain